MSVELKTGMSLRRASDKNANSVRARKLQMNPWLPEIMINAGTKVTKVLFDTPKTAAFTERARKAVINVNENNTNEAM
jgi:hypothetical protein